MPANTSAPDAGFPSTQPDGTAGIVRTLPEQTGLFGQRLTTSVHTYETSLQAAGLADDPAFCPHDPALKFYSRFANNFAYERFGMLGAPASDGERDRRHGWWMPERAAVRAALASAGLPASRLDRFDQCGSACFILGQRETGKLKRSSNKCRDRHCKPCSIERANLYAANLKKRLAQYRGRPSDRFRFVTLTLRSSDDPLDKQFRRWMQAFTALRRIRLCNLKRRKLRNWWESYVVGGCYFLEATLNDQTGRWHVHAHLLIEGGFLPHAELKACWRLATGDSDVVDVRSLSGVDDVAAELSKYAAKGAGAKLAAAGGKLAEWIIGTKGLRFCSTFGTWRGFRLAQPVDEFEPGRWVNLGREDDIRAKAHAGDAWARGILSALEQQTDPNRFSSPPPARCSNFSNGADPTPLRESFPH